MTSAKPLYALTSFLVMAIALPGCATFRERSNDRADDAKISANVETQLDRHPELGPSHSIDVQTIDHVVYLDGIVSSDLGSETAESVADEAPGVARVVNDIAVTN